MITSSHWNYAATATHCSLLLVFVSSAAAAATATYRVRPESTAVLINRTVSLRCAFDGLSAKDQVNWYWYNPRSAAKLYHISSGLNVAPEFPRYLIAGNQRKGEHHLKIQNALPEDEGNYRCSVFSVRDAGDAKLTVVVPPSQPPIISGDVGPRLAGEGLVLSCLSEGGRPPPRLKWYNGTEQYVLPTSSPGQSAGVSSASLDLVVSQLQRWDNGVNLSCVAEQVLPGLTTRQTTSRTLRINYPPTVTLPVKSVRVVEGEPANLTCLVESNPASVLQWTKLGGKSMSRAQRRGYTFRIPRVSRADSGTYQCVADNGVEPRGVGTISVEVICPPLIKPTFEEEVSVLFGQDWDLECVANGNPKPKIKWRRKNNRTLLDNPLSLSPLTYQTEGLYECVAWSDRFPEVSRETFINVMGRPDVLADAAPVMVTGGDTVRLTCHITSDPPPDYVDWVWKGVSGHQKKYRPGRTGDITVKMSGDSQSTLTIGTADPVHSGDYICTATNMFGSDQEKFRVEVSESWTVLIAAITMGIVVGILIAIIAMLCLRTRKMWKYRHRKADSVTRPSESFSYCAPTDNDVSGRMISNPLGNPRGDIPTVCANVFELQPTGTPSKHFSPLVNSDSDECHPCSQMTVQSTNSYSPMMGRDMGDRYVINRPYYIKDLKLRVAVPDRVPDGIEDGANDETLKLTPTKHRNSETISNGTGFSKDCHPIV
ncbi:kin of IRRE-like protein 3 isoform X1 [Branchiostoma lanceolatum]|uniref:kin of IRRE-like protein 3 isoform X1 n=1 Tax=Branchiostoma lanceolatum TaxID=7740 RepID=UPI0034523465